MHREDVEDASFKLVEFIDEKLFDVVIFEVGLKG